MNPATIIAVCAACTGFGTGVLAINLMRFPSKRRYGRHALALIGFSAAGYAVFDCFGALPGYSAEFRARAAEFNLAFSSTYIMGWILFDPSSSQQRASTPTRIGMSLLVIGLIVGLIPGVLYTRTIIERRVSWLDLLYYDAVPTTIGEIYFATYAGILAVWCIRFLVRRRAGDHRVGLFAIALGVQV
ncbi:MAG: hypothetical protein KC416_17245, partial [Myxococcales bacterium]|nr:hypothetical protein [Myxococcales bacterium]